MSNQKTILIIDDDTNLIEALAARCRKIGLQVETARNLLTAVVIMDRKLPDLLCVDINMPTGNGLNFCEMLSLDENTSKIPVIVLSGQKDPDTLLRCQNLCAYYVHKSNDVWRSMEPVIYELIDIEPSNAALTAQEPNSQSL